MTERSEPGGDAVREEDLHEQGEVVVDLDSNGEGEQLQGAGATGSGEPGEGEQRARAPRPGKLERRLQRTERELAQHRADLEQERRQRAALEDQLRKAHESGTKLASANLDAALTSAEQELRDAIVGNDAEAIVKAQRKVSTLAAEQVNLQRHPARPATPPAETRQSFTPTTQAWLNANAWYGQDPEMTALARSAANAAARRGVPVDSPEYWAAVRRAVEAVNPGLVRDPGASADPEDLDEEEELEDRGRQTAARPSAPAPRPGARPAPGAPVVRSAPRAPAQPQQVRLSAQEVDAAKLLGMTPQEYAAEKRKLSAAGKIDRKS